MKATGVLNFESTGLCNLRRPWQTFRNGQIWYGLTKLGSKRHPLTSKQGNKNFYKGTGSSGNGRCNKHGIFIMNWSKVRTYVVPADLQNTPLKALVSPNVPQIRQKFVGFTDGPKSPELAWDNIKNFIEHGESYDVQDLEKSDYLEKFVSSSILSSTEEDSAGKLV